MGGRGRRKGGEKDDTSGAVFHHLEKGNRLDADVREGGEKKREEGEMAAFFSGMSILPNGKGGRRREFHFDVERFSALGSA